MKACYDIHIEGLVQGVGFRPFIYRVANQLHLKGCVDNRVDGVHICLQSSETEKQQFIQTILTEKPDIIQIDRILIKPDNRLGAFRRFSILPSRKVGDGGVTAISPDIAVCKACLNDIEHQSNRIGYPFVNCTHCGPRFSITRDLPYDRASTMMGSFQLCRACTKEYNKESDRRFHAQPVACNNCGPHLKNLSQSDSLESDLQLVARMADIINRGGVIAVKGLGGYNLLGRPDNRIVVKRIRSIKRRESKPLAVLFKDVESLTPYIICSESERAVLESWRRPIVLLDEKTKLCEDLNPQLSRLGVMLPYLPMHYLLFRQLSFPAMIYTSANQSDDPIVSHDNEAVCLLASQVDLLVGYNREIHNRVDDSVVQVQGGITRVIRRSRGYAPESIEAFCTTEGILAMGAEMVNTFSIGKSNRIIPSQYIGDLKSAQTEAFYLESLHKMSRLFRFTPSSIICDMHPNYISTRIAKAIAAEKSVPLIQIQHHFAHAASVMAEHRLSDDVLAICLDGTGYGDDGQSWGGEFLICNPVTYTRISHLPYVALPGGDKAASEPWRMVVAYSKLFETGPSYPRSFENKIGHSKIDVIENMIDKQINTPLTSSTGRLFDGVAALLGIGYDNRYQAELAVRLEQSVDRNALNRYEIKADSLSDSIAEMWRLLQADCLKNKSRRLLATQFHNTLAFILGMEALRITSSYGLDRVVLSGGVFQNRLLTGRLSQLLEQRGLSVYTSQQIPCNDGGISVGQLFIAANRLKTGYYA